MNSSVSNAANTPLWEFIRKIAEIQGFDQENRAIGVLDRVEALPTVSEAELIELAQAFREVLSHLTWPDVARWIETEVPSYRQGIEQLAAAAKQAHEL